jgi:hypothetical protein
MGLRINVSRGARIRGDRVLCPESFSFSYSYSFSFSERCDVERKIGTRTSRSKRTRTIQGVD